MSQQKVQDSRKRKNNYKNDSENLLYTNVDPQLFLTMWTVNMIYFIGVVA